MFKKITKFFYSDEKKEVLSEKSDKLPREAQVYLAAIHCLQQGNYPVALQHLNELISGTSFGFEPEQDSQLLYNRSIAKSNLRDYSGAFSDLQRSIEIFELAVANFEIFRLNEQLGKPNDGMDFLVRAYKMGHSNAEDVLRNNTNYFNR